MFSRLKEPPKRQNRVGPLAMPVLSVAVKVTGTVSPEFTEILAGLKVSTGGSVSLEMVPLSVAVPVFPAVSVALAVHVKEIKRAVTGAV